MFHHAIEDGHLAVSLTPRILRHAHTDPPRKNDFFTEEETAASLLIQQGESFAYVKEQMGHHSITITVDTYSHLMPGGNKAAVDRLDRLETATIRNPDATASENPFFDRREVCE
jgi:integrase